MSRSLVRRLATLAIVALVAPLAALTTTPAPPAAGVADYRPVDPPYVQTDRAGDAAVSRKRLARTDLTRREAKAADFTEVRYAIVDHDGEPSAQIAVRLSRVLPDRPERHTQGVQIYVDEEAFIDTDVHTERARWRSSYGGPGSDAPGCARLDAETTGRTVTQWIPLRCLLNDSSEMYVNGVVWATAPDGVPGSTTARRQVGSDGATRAPAFIRWR